MGNAIHRHAALRHRFQQGGLSPWRRAIDFVGEHELSENWSRSKFELGILLIEDRLAGDVGRQKIGRALNALKRAANATSQRPSQHRFRNPRDVLKQYVSLAEPGNKSEYQLLTFTDDDSFDVGDDFFRGDGDVNHIFLVGYRWWVG